MSVDEKIALARRFVAEVAELATKYGLNFFVVTDGTSGIRNSGNPAVEHAQGAHGMEAQITSIRRTTGRRIRMNSNLHEYQNGNRAYSGESRFNVHLLFRAALTVDLIQAD